MPGSALRLGVNIDHVATVRNARGGRVPDPVRAALIAERAGADGITAHLREDRRHITDDDIARLRSEIALPLNLEMAATDEMLAIALRHLAEATPLTLGKVTLTWTPGQASALDTRAVADGKDVGNVRAVDAAGDDVLHDIVFAFVYHAFFPHGEIVQ